MIARMPRERRVWLWLFPADEECEDPIAVQPPEREGEGHERRRVYPVKMSAKQVK
jgi:hypothetical protein